MGPRKGYLSSNVGDGVVLGSMSWRAGSRWISSPLVVQNSAVARGDKGVGSVEGLKSPSTSGLRAGGTPILFSILVMYGP